MSSEGTVSNIRICILSRSTIQTRLLGEFLAAELDAEYVLQEDFDTCISVASLNPTPAVLLLDAALMGTNQMLSRLPAASALPAHVTAAMFNVKAEDGIEQSAVRRGIRGFFYQEESPATLVKGIRLLAQGEAWVSRRILLDAALEGSEAPKQMDNGRDQLTQRETEILAMICVGARNEDIADKLFISANTVKTHIYNIYKKIRVPNRTQAALWAAKHL